ncbi:MAG: 4-hydroxy-tetrahydrodipicolinate synthase [Gaiellales bacterium]|jgi:4-hydroxy-tetrahydrodipicolinate synthase|nr:4-hydroxy-tetrahydrodipicolinate synthase [Gaiellales bacterium]
MNRPILGELLTAMVTPFAGDGSVSHDAARRMARHLIDSGSDGIVVCGTTGEGPTVSDREKLDLFETVVSEVGAGATVIANTGSYDTHHSVALTRSATATGVDGFLVVTPYYNKPPAAGIIAHFEAIAEAAEGRPVIVYNIPQRVVLNLEPELLERLARIENVIAVKQATADLDQARRIVAHGALDLYAGNDDLVMPFMRLGGAGGICVASHIAGRRIREMIALSRGGDMDGAQRIDDELRPLYDALSVTTNPIPLKAALNLLGHDVGGLRLPLVDADEAEVASVQAALAVTGLLPTATA